MILGCHCGMSGTTMMLGSVKEALSYGANALMIYTGAPQNTVRKQLKDLHIEEALKLMDEYNIDIFNINYLSHNKLNYKNTKIILDISII